CSWTGQGWGGAIAPAETVSEPSHFALSLSVIPNRMRYALSSSAAATLIGTAPALPVRFRVDGRNQAMRARQANRRIKLSKRNIVISPDYQPRRNEEDEERTEKLRAIRLSPVDFLFQDVAVTI